MTVRCINEYNKSRIAHEYAFHDATLRSLARAYNTSQRTIGRILAEYGLYTPVPRLQAEAQEVMGMLKAYKLNADSLRKILVERATQEVASKTETEMRKKVPALLRSSFSSPSTTHTR